MFLLLTQSSIENHSVTTRTWTYEDEIQLRKAIENQSLTMIPSPSHAPETWESISQELESRFTPLECFQHWMRMENDDDSSSSSTSPVNQSKELSNIKGPWTNEEDELLKSLVERYGTKHWSLIAQFLPRTGKQCRERWCNYLNPAIKRTAWTTEEEDIIIETQVRINKYMCSNLTLNRLA